MKKIETIRFTETIKFFISIGILCFSCFSGQAQIDSSPISLIIDADTANEVDDLYAIVRAIEEPNFDLIGINSAQFHTSPLASKNSVGESQRLNEEIIAIMDIKDIRLPLGSNIPLTEYGVPVTSEASQFIIKSAHEMADGQKLNVVILGPCTNVASAILEDPSIIPKLHVYYLGFWHAPSTNVYDKKEFNSGNDPIAVEVLLNTKNLEFSVMTAATSQHLVLKKEDVDAHLKNKDGIAEYLINRWESFDRWWTKVDPEKKEWVMWDVAIIEALAHPELATIKQLPTPPENTRRTIGVYTDLDSEKMTQSFWNSLNNL